jgi:hypothetical protein
MSKSKFKISLDCPLKFEGASENFKNHQRLLSKNITSGVYILENTLPPGGGEYRPMSFGGKNMKR